MADEDRKKAAAKKMERVRIVCLPRTSKVMVRDVPAKGYGAR